MNPLRAFRSWPRAIRLALFGVFCAALWIPILHTWWRGPWGDPVPNARHWEWPVSTAAAEGFDPGKLASLVKLLAGGERTPHLQALLIIRHGRLVTEEYFRGVLPWLGPGPAAHASIGHQELHVGAGRHRPGSRGAQRRPRTCSRLLPKGRRVCRLGRAKGCAPAARSAHHAHRRRLRRKRTVLPPLAAEFAAVGPRHLVSAPPYALTSRRRVPLRQRRRRALVQHAPAPDRHARRGLRRALSLRPSGYPAAILAGEPRRPYAYGRRPLPHRARYRQTRPTVPSKRPVG